jgi:hypothetical protein
MKTTQKNTNETLKFKLVIAQDTIEAGKRFLIEFTLPSLKHKSIIITQKEFLNIAANIDKIHNYCDFQKYFLS